MGEDEEFALDTVDGFIATFRNTWHSGNAHYPFFGALYCPTCGAKRRVEAQVIKESAAADFNNIRGKFPLKMLWSKGAGLPLPTTVVLGCLQCHGRFYAMIFERDGDLALALFPDRLGGAGSPNCPAGVAFYLDQAARAHAGVPILQQ